MTAGVLVLISFACHVKCYKTDWLDMQKYITKVQNYILMIRLIDVNGNDATWTFRWHFQAKEIYIPFYISIIQPGHHLRVTRLLRYLMNISTWL